MDSDDNYDLDYFSDSETVDQNEAEYEASLDSIMNEEQPHQIPDKLRRYQVLTVEQIHQLMNESISEAMTVIELPNNVIRILLNHFNWDKHKLFEQYFDGNKEKLFSDARIVNPYNDMSSAPKKKKRNQLCLICYNEVLTTQMTSISCGHEFCICEYSLIALFMKV